MKKLLLCSLVASLAACGGSGGGGGSKVKVGSLPELKGVTYRTETQNGTIGDDGKFQYQQGETLMLLAGDTVLAELPVSAEIALSDLFPGLPQNAAELRSALRTPFYQRVMTSTKFEKIGVFDELNYEFSGGDYTGFHNLVNKARLLIALDSNNNLADGVDISANASAIDGLEVNLNANLYEFADDIATLNYQQQSGISLAMEMAKPVKQVFALAGISIDAARRTASEPKVANEHGSGKQEYFYNAAGQLTQQNYRKSNDMERKFYSYDAASNRVIERDYQVFAIVDDEIQAEARAREIYQHGYNDFGIIDERTYQRFDPNNISQLASASTATYSYQQDRALPLISRKREDFKDTISGSHFDNSLSKRFSYNPNNLLQPVSWKRFEGTTPEDEEETTTSAFTYDQTGFLVDLGGAKFAKEAQGDNTVFSRTNGNQTIEEVFNRQGNLITRNMLTYDKKVNGGDYLYDSEGRLSSCMFESQENSQRYGTAITYGDYGVQSLSFVTSGPANPPVQLSYGSEGQLLTDGSGNNLTYSEPQANGISYLVYEQYMDHYNYDHVLFERSIEVLVNFNQDICQKKSS